MNIDISKEEYRLLLDMLYLSDWMMNAHLVDAEQQRPEHQALRKKLLSYYKEMGAEDMIEYSAENDSYYELTDYDDYLHKAFVEPYDDHTFWDGLVDRLAIRDLSHEIGVEQYNAMEGNERTRKLTELVEHYENEFQQHGLENIKLDYDSVVKN